MNIRQRVKPCALTSCMIGCGFMYISVLDFAKEFGVTRQAVNLMILKKRLPARKVGRAFIIDEKYLGRFEVIKTEKRHTLKRL